MIDFSCMLKNPFLCEGIFCGVVKQAFHNSILLIFQIISTNFNPRVVAIILIAFL